MSISLAISPRGVKSSSISSANRHVVCHPTATIGQTIDQKTQTNRGRGGKARLARANNEKRRVFRGKKRGAEKCREATASSRLGKRMIAKIYQRRGKRLRKRTAAPRKRSRT